MLDGIHISDVHLGEPMCQVAQLRRFLMDLPPTRYLVFVGDLMDDPDQRLPEDHAQILYILHQVKSYGTKVIWVAGNHDDLAYSWASQIGTPFVYAFTYRSGDTYVYSIHGHQYDPLMREWRWLRHVLEAPFHAMERVNHRAARRLKRWSKCVGRCDSRVEDGAYREAAYTHAGIVCAGHTHYEAHSHVGNVDYWNLGSVTNSRWGWLGVKEGLAEWHWYDE